MTIDAVIKGLALSFFESFRSSDGKERESPIRESALIEVVSIGALRYRDIRDGSIADGSSMKDDFLTLRTFSVDFRKTSDGVGAPLLTQVAKGSTSGIQDTYKNISVLQPYWLT